MFRSWAIFGMLAGVVFAAAPDPWLRMKSENFELFTTAGERGGRDLIRHLEQVRSFFAQAFHLQGPPARPAAVIAFRSEKEYEPYRPNEVASAFFHGGAYRDFIVMPSVSSDHYPAAVHEYIHLLVHQSEMKIPVWLNEGLAELYSNLQPQGNKVIVGKVLPGRGQVLNNQNWIPLRDLVAVDHNSPLYNEKARAGMFYAESWLLVHMLQMSPEYAQRFSALTGELAKADGAAAFLKTYGKSIDRVDLDLRDYMHSPTLSARLFPVQLAKALDAPEIETGAGLKARLALAEMQSGRADGRAKSEAAYRQLAAEFPKGWEVEAAMARMLVQGRAYAEAARHFERARELGSKDARMYLEYGKLLTYSARYPDALTPFRTAVALDADLVEAHVELGIALGRTNAFREAILEFQKIKHITPSLAPRYFYNFAYALYRMDAMDEARALIGKARPHTRNQPEIDALDRLAQALEKPRGRGPAMDVSEPAGPPRMVRRPDVQEDAPPPPAALPARPVAEGVLQTIECNGVQARLHAKVNDAVQIFLIDDASMVAIRGGAGEPVELTCGKQTPRNVRIGFDPDPEMPGIAGVVRALDFP